MPVVTVVATLDVINPTHEQHGLKVEHGWLRTGIEDKVVSWGDSLSILTVARCSQCGDTNWNEVHGSLHY